MTTWTDEELNRIGGAGERQLASLRKDGTLRPYVTMWVVRAGDDLHVRSAHGPSNPWYRRAKTSGAGRIRAGGLQDEADAGWRLAGQPPVAGQPDAVSLSPSRDDR